MGKVPPDPALSVKVRPTRLTRKADMSLLPALTTRSDFASLLRTSPSWLLPVRPAAPRPLVANVPFNVRIPSAPLLYARTLLPDGLLVIMKTAPGEPGCSLLGLAAAAGTTRTKREKTA